MPASRITASTGSERSAAARSESSRSATNTVCGAWSTSSVRSHQSRSPDSATTLGLRDDLSIVAEVLNLAEAVVPLRLRRPAVAADRVMPVQERVRTAEDREEEREHDDQAEHPPRAVPEGRGPRGD